MAAVLLIWGFFWTKKSQKLMQETIHILAANTSVQKSTLEHKIWPYEMTGQGEQCVLWVYVKQKSQKHCGWLLCSLANLANFASYCEGGNASL